MRTKDRIWTLFNRKPPRKYQSYIQIVIPWVFVGFTVALGTSILPTYAAEALVIFVFATLMGLTYLWVDKKQKYVDCIHANSLVRWRKKREEINEANSE